MASYRIAQPWGRDRARQATLISEHPTAADAFEAMERLAELAQRTDGRIEVLELVEVSGGWERPDGRIPECGVCLMVPPASNMLRSGERVGS